MKPSIVVFLLFITLQVKAQKASSRVLLDTTGYKLEVIDADRFRSYMSGSDKHSGVDTIDSNTIKYFSPFSDHIIVLRKTTPGKDVLTMYDATDVKNEKELFKIHIPYPSVDVTLCHWTWKTTAVIKGKKAGEDFYLMATFKAL